MTFSIFSLFNRLCIIEAVSYYRENFNRTGERADSLKGQPALLLLLLLLYHPDAFEIRKNRCPKKGLWLQPPFFRTFARRSHEKSRSWRSPSLTDSVFKLSPDLAQVADTSFAPALFFLQTFFYSPDLLSVAADDECHNISRRLASQTLNYQFVFNFFSLFPSELPRNECYSRIDFHFINNFTPEKRQTTCFSRLYSKKKKKTVC